MPSFYFNALRIFVVLPVIFFSAILAAAQDGPLVLLGVSEQKGTAPVSNVGSCFTPGGYMIVLRFNRNLTPKEEAALLKPGIYTIWQILKPGFVPKNASDASMPTLKVSAAKTDCCEKNLVYLCPQKPLDEDYEDVNSLLQPYQYLFLMEDNSGAAFKNSTTAILSKAAFVPANNVTKNAANVATLDVRESKSKEDSNVYIAGELTGAHSSKPVYSVDVRVRIPFVAKRPEAKFVLDLKASTSKKADPDSMSAGIEYGSYMNDPLGLASRMDNLFGGGADQKKDTCTTENAECPKYDEGLPLGRIEWNLYGKLEFDREFTNKNLVGGGNLKFPLRVFNRRSTRWNFDPFIGFDAGRNLNSPVPQAEGKGLFRPYAGITTFIGFFRTKKIFPFSFEGTYTHRWLVLREIELKSNSQSQLTAISLNKKPRFFVDAKFNFQLNPFFGFFAGYQYGELPPLYKLVDHSFKLGLVYKFRFKRAGEN